MKKFIIIPLIIVGFAAWYGGYKLILADNNILGSSTYTKALLPSVYSKRDVITERWYPNWTAQGRMDLSSVSSPYVLVYNLTDDYLIYERNARIKTPVASITKIMTAMVVLDHLDPNHVVTVSERAGSIGENSMGISPGEKYTIEELVYGIILNSGNDASEALAEAVGNGNREIFIDLMNKKALELGMRNTQFANPSGLTEIGKTQYSTAEDLLVMSRHAIRNYPLIRSAAKTYEYQIPHKPSNKALHLYNQTNLLTTYPGVKGLKPGYTKAAGLCLITYAEIYGKDIIAIVLDSPNRREEMKTILDLTSEHLPQTL